MSKLPAIRRPPGASPIELVRTAALSQRQTTLAIFEHHQAARFVSECLQADTEARADVVRTALAEELSLLDWGMQQATGSGAKAELVSSKVSLLRDMNNQLIRRGFGGLR
jgi:hypothetical protein